MNRRLLAVDDDRLEVAHEALLTAWPRLVRWLEDDAAGRAVRRHLAPAARDWETGGRPDDELYRGARLSAALDWAEGADTDVTTAEQRFLAASREAAETELLSAQQRADREAAARHRTRRLAVGLAAVLVVAVVAAVLAVRAQRQAQDASVVADANRLAALSTTVGQLDLALLLSAQGVRLADTPEAQDGLLAALSEHGRAERVIGFDGFPYAIGLADEGRVLFLDRGPAVMALDPRGSSEPRTVFEYPLDPEGPLGGLSIVAPSPTDDVLLTAGVVDDSLWVRTVAADGSLHLVVEGAAIGGLPVGGGFSPDGRQVRLLVVALPDPDRPDEASRWRMVEVDVADGTVRDAGLAGVLRAPADALVGSVDGDAAVLTDSRGIAGSVVIDWETGRAVTAPAVSRAAQALDMKPLPTGAAQLWDDGAVTLFDRTGAVVQQLEVHQEPVRDVVVAPDGTWAVTAGDGPLVVVWDIDAETGRWSQRDVLSGHAGDVRDLAVDATGSRMFTVSTDDTIITWDMSPDGGFGEAYPGLDGRWIPNRPAVVGPDGLLVAPTRPGTSIGEAGSGPGPGTESVSAAFIDPDTGEVVDEVPLGDTLARAGSGTSVAVSPDGSMVAVTWALGTTVLDARTHDEITTIDVPPNGTLGTDGEPLAAAPVWAAAWTPAGDTLLLGVSSGDLVEPTGGYLVQVDTRTWQIRYDSIGVGGAQSMQLSPDEELLAIASTSDDVVVFLDATTLEVVRTIPLAPDDRGINMAFSPDGRLLAVGSQDGAVYVLDTEAWEPVAGPAQVHDGVLLQVEWLDDGRTVVTSGQDGTVALFDVQRGLVRGQPLPGSADAGEGATFLVPSPTDELVVLSGDRAGRRYPLEPSAWLEEACAVAGRNLTRAEWDRYLPDRPYERTCP